MEYHPVSANIPVWVDDKWPIPEAVIASLRKIDLKKAVGDAWIEGFVRSLLHWADPETSNNRFILSVFVDEVRAYRRDHRFYDCV